MIRALLLLTISSLSCVGVVASAASTAARNQVTCQNGDSALSITPKGAGTYAVTFRSTRASDDYSLEGLRRKLPNMDEDMLKKLATAMAADAKGENEPAGCTTVGNCIFSDVGASNLVTCSSTIDGVSFPVLTLDLTNGRYALTCRSLQRVTVDKRVDGGNFRSKKSTYDTAFLPADCAY